MSVRFPCRPLSFTPVMRKLLTILNAMLKENQSWNPEKLQNA